MLVSTNLHYPAAIRQTNLDSLTLYKWALYPPLSYKLLIYILADERHILADKRYSSNLNFCASLRSVLIGDNVMTKAEKALVNELLYLLSLLQTIIEIPIHPCDNARNQAGLMKAKRLAQDIKAIFS